MKNKLVSNKVLNSLTVNEKKILDKLIKNHQDLQNDMIIVQRAYTDAVRGGKIKETVLRKMADKGFKAEYKAYEALKKLQSFIKAINKKYA